GGTGQHRPTSQSYLNGGKENNTLKTNKTAGEVLLQSVTLKSKMIGKFNPYPLSTPEAKKAKEVYKLTEEMVTNFSKRAKTSKKSNLNNPTTASSRIPSIISKENWELDARVKLDRQFKKSESQPDFDKMIIILLELEEIGNDLGTIGIINSREDREDNYILYHPDGSSELYDPHSPKDPHDWASTAYYQLHNYYSGHMGLMNGIEATANRFEEWYPGEEEVCERGLKIAEICVDCIRGDPMAKNYSDEEYLEQFSDGKLKEAMKSYMEENPKI
ncbi:MAG: hypothetical protein AAGG81_07315, partial [Chlamydiota bacterium]